MIRTKGIFFALAVVLITAFLGWWALSQRPEAPPNVTVTLLGYTNDATGARLAAFAVSNLSPSAVWLQSHYRVQTPTATRWTNLANGWLPGGSRLLNTGTSQTIAVPLLGTTNRPWRVSLSVSPDVGFVRETMEKTVVPLRSVGLKTRHYKANYGVCCDWIRE